MPSSGYPPGQYTASFALQGFTTVDAQVTVPLGDPVALNVSMQIGAVREELVAQGFQITPVIDRDYFHSIYFRAPGGVLFEIATNEPGFASDEDMAHLGEALKLPKQHTHLRERLEASLPRIGN